MQTLMRNVSIGAAIAVATGSGATFADQLAANAPADTAPSIMAQAYGMQVSGGDVFREEPHALRAVSMFAIPPEQPRIFQEHDLVQIVVSETSKAESTHELETEKEFKLDGGIDAFPSFSLSDLLQLQIMAGRTTALPQLKMDFTKEFTGEGDYKREDDLTARLTAEVIEVQPNGNLVLEARTFIKTDDEEHTIKVTGICRAADITAANTVLSNQIHDLRIEKATSGELRGSAKKGIISKTLETIFAF